MSNKIKVALLCNNKMAIPAMHRMATDGVLCSIASADTDPEVLVIVSMEAAKLNIPYCKISKSGYSAQIAAWLRECQPDVVFVMTFPYKIGRELLAIPRLGFINFHYGLLPQMRGADPIFESVRNMLPIAGTTVHIMDDGLDTGPVLLREEMPVQPEFTYGMLSSQLGWMGDKLCAQLLIALTKADEGQVKEGEWCGMPLATQDESKAKYWPKVGEDSMTIYWDKMTCAEIIALVRSCNPIARGGAPTSINGWKLGVCDVSEINLQGASSDIAPGTIVAMDMQNGLIVFCKDGKGVRLDVVYTGEGVFPGFKLAFFGMQLGMKFG